MKVRVYTDGACSGNPGPGGWAARVLFPKGIVELRGGEVETTNNRMELKAVIEALRYLAEKGNKSKVEIYSDSAYVIGAVKQHWLKKWVHNGWLTAKDEPVKNKDLWLELLKLIKVDCKGVEVNLIKVKGHSGDVNNERVDKLARREKEKLMSA